MWRRGVHRARRLQLKRNGCLNARLDVALRSKHCRLDDRTMRLLETAVDRLGLSARAVERVVRVSRTIADLAGDTALEKRHIAEALSLRPAL